MSEQFIVYNGADRLTFAEIVGTDITPRAGWIFDPEGNIGLADINTARLSDTEIILFIEANQSAGPVRMVHITYTGGNASTITIGDSLQFQSTAVFTHRQRWTVITSETSRQVVVSYRDQAGGVSPFYQVVSVSDLGDITIDLPSRLDLYTTQIDHITTDIFPGTNSVYALSVGQEEDSVPDRQIITRVLNSS